MPRCRKSARPCRKNTLTAPLVRVHFACRALQPNLCALEEGFEMSFTDYERDLRDPQFDPNYVLDKYFHSAPSAVFAGAPPGEEARLKQQVASKLLEIFGVRVHVLQLVVCGSAHLGFCPIASEVRFGKPFHPGRSDIDIAVISPELFESWWTELQSIALDTETRSAVSRDLFWGFLNPALLRDVGQNGPKWWGLFGALRTDRARGIRGRLYKNLWSMQSYHRIAVVEGHNRLVGAA